MDLRGSGGGASLGHLLGRWTGFSYLRKKYRTWKQRRSVLAETRSRKGSLAIRSGGEGGGSATEDGTSTVSLPSTIKLSRTSTDISLAIDDGRLAVLGAEKIMMRGGAAAAAAAPLTADDQSFLQAVQALSIKPIHHLHSPPSAGSGARSSRYIVQQTIGTGSFSRVKLALDTARGTRVAIKMIPLRDLAQSSRLRQTLCREVQVLRQIRHPRVVELVEALVVHESAWLVMEYVPGMELFQYVADRGRLPEAEARLILHQLAEAVQYLHQRGVIHRDLKLENVIVHTLGPAAGKEDGVKITLVDFGLARLSERHEALLTRCGSEEYAAPEVILGVAYDGRLSDAWSLGVILYACLVGSLPFNPDSRRPRALSEKIVAGSYRLPSEYVSPEAAKVIAGLLQVDPRNRTSIPQLLQDPYLCPPLAV